jgi:signal transduction histidine kinase
MANVYKRRLIPIVDRRFQLKYTGIIVATAALVSIVLGYFLLQSYVEMNKIIGLSADVGERMNADDAKFVFRLSIGFLVGEVFVLGILGILITHRVCGPIFVVHRHLNALLLGGFPKVRPLRAGDEFGGMFETFQALVEKLRERDQVEVEKLKGVVASAKEKGLAADQLRVLEDLLAERTSRLSGTVET